MKPDDLPTPPTTPDTHTPAGLPGATGPTTATSAAAGTERPASGCPASGLVLESPGICDEDKRLIEYANRSALHHIQLGIQFAIDANMMYTSPPASAEPPAESPTVAEGAD